jgi:hypothetical protein
MRVVVPGFGETGSRAEGHVVLPERRAVAADAGTREAEGQPWPAQRPTRK